MDFLTMFITSMKMCVTSVVCVVLPLHHAESQGFRHRATNFGDVIFVDHAETMLRKNKCIVLLVLDGATNLCLAAAQSSLNNG